VSRKKFQVYWLSEAEPNVHAVVRYDGDPDVFAALAYKWLLLERRHEEPVAVCPPEPRLWRWNPSGHDDPPLYLTERTRPGRGTWLGALLKTVRIGCSDCHRVYASGHAPDCVSYGVTGLATLQFQGDGFGAGSYATPKIVHAVRRRDNHTTPGPTLCGMYRFDSSGIPWTVGGGVVVDGVKGCFFCQRTARNEFAGLPIHGLLPLAVAFAGNGIPLAPNLAAELAARAANSNHTGDLATVWR
jgi:hypothetical protein